MLDTESEFNARDNRYCLHDLPSHDNAFSVYGSAPSLVNDNTSNRHSVISSMAAKRTEAAAELAAKETEYEMMLKEHKQRELIQELEETQRKELEVQRRTLKRLQTERELKVAQAKLEVYNKETVADPKGSEHGTKITSLPVTVPLSHSATPLQSDTPSLAQVLQDNLTLNRLPVSEPLIFSGDPMQCMEGLLIGNNCSRNEEPYAVKTDLGWSIAGQPSQGPGSLNISRFCQRINANKMPPTTSTNAIHLLEPDFKNCNKDTTKISQDDINFPNKLDEVIRKNTHSHYDMPLPFKDRPSLPDNKVSMLAKKRLDHIRRKTCIEKCIKTCIKKHIMRKRRRQTCTKRRRRGQTFLKRKRRKTCIETCIKICIRKHIMRKRRRQTCTRRRRRRKTFLKRKRRKRCITKS
ncbi:uncharacterized protein LOC121705509 isoform X2 [Alosa sapidissima]|uniref:uncharacterized protein LOC121705509 isoform X2 n=1 Tax=Alosa sapidissima TaxID=34773 RepID=UPI001C08DEB0|nr:uncharacterized protein LOC121705509 isoform X2 [Alosa sapidissima]